MQKKNGRKSERKIKVKRIERIFHSETERAHIRTVNERVALLKIQC